MGEFLGQYADYPAGDIVNYSAYSHQFGVDHWNDYNGSLVKVGDSIYFDNILSVSGDTPPGFALISGVFGTSCTTPGVYNFVLYLLNGTNVPWRLVVYSGSFTETYHNFTIDTGVPISISTLDAGYHDVWIFTEPPNYLLGPPPTRIVIPQGITYNSDTAIFYGTPTMAYYLVLYMIVVKLDAGFNCIYEHVSFKVNLSPDTGAPSVNACSVGGIFMPNISSTSQVINTCTII
jgi:hypothetical protein